MLLMGMGPTGDAEALGATDSEVESVVEDERGDCVEEASTELA
jgi:hypothetical protein